MAKEKKDKKTFNTLIDGAFIVIVGQNALLLSKPILSFCKNNLAILPFLAFLFIGIVNTINIVFIWLSSKENENNYSSKYFVWDVITIVLLFTFTQICLDSFVDFNLTVNIKWILLVFAIVYLIIYIGYIFWNIEEVRINKIIGLERKKIRNLNIYISVYLASLVILLSACIVDILIFLYVSFGISLVIVLFIFIIFCKNFTGKEGK